VHDLMGMIIKEESNVPINELGNSADNNHIYYSDG
jgi:hypothetical protein